ncbi:hypothetical protein DACRYDRAFT_24092 [Dacryopinax primogenitus]|uniref:Uncharacterized protein n=1 Tax=Dacryopinax primogenitus (strain DJM 731) TaxID=1858805 RepID=M5FZJ5_DACPD|nr:uncharacterized protein DACRYDRAFT_24092 [Dacryopinax primogenitus]EJT98986.1 hypothetical protein DACRYDRAFT_24092 [Dacryopinax primogenitus]
MSSLPPREQGPKTAGRVFNRFAHRDPGLYPLAGIMFLVFAGAGFFLATKSQSPDVAKKFAVVQHPSEWQNTSRVEAWKTRVKSAGHDKAASS